MSVNPIGTSEPTEAEILVLKRRIAELERSELFASIQRDTALAIVSDGSYRDSLKEILAVVCRLDEVDAGMVYVLNKAENVFDLVASHSLEETTQQMIRQFPSDDYPGQLAYINGPGYFDLNDSRYFPPEFDGLQGLHRVMIFPALLEDEVVASLIFATRSRSELPLDTSRTIEALSVLICESVARRSVEEALGASRASFQALFNSIEDMVFITDAHGVVLDCNPAVSKILGYSDEDICGNAVTTLSPDEMSEANCQGLKDLRDKQRVKFRMEVTTKEGLIIPVEVSAARAYWYNQEAMLGIARDLREEVKSEQMRTESEERFRSIVDGMTDYLFFLDEDCIFREFHCPGHSDRLLMPPEEFLGRRAVDCIPPQIVEDFEKAWSHLRAGNRVCELEYNLVDSKTNGWYRACLVRRNDPDGGFIGATAHIRDITANRHLDGELHSQRQRMELALRGGEIGIWDINTRNGTVYTGQNMNRILGQESKTTSSTLDEFRQIIHPADLHRFHREWGRYIGGKVQILELECRVAVQNDVWKWVLIRGAVNQTDEAGLPEHLSGILIDVDELRRVSEVAEERLQLLQTLIDTIPSPIYYKDITGRYLGCNQAFAQLMKMERDEIVGKTVHEMPEILYPLSCDDADHTLLHHPGVQVYEASIDKRDMSRQHYIYHKATFTNGEGELSGLVGVMIDISERQRNEEALRNAKEQAEALNRELSRSIEQANKLAVVAESANKAKSQFLANMSHEIRTPMNGIIGMAGLLLDSSIEGEEREFIQTILQSAEALMSIIGDILNLSQIEAGKLEPENSSFALRELCEDICSVLAVKAQAKGLNMACVIDPEVPTGINGDSGRLRQVLINLLGNAIKFTNEGEVNLIISQVPGDDPYHLRFEVADTGIGIPA
ncbi:MAG: PAS domain S-box protein, partial [bacterium]|nr:PAS domain S-box protein [bacterium]